MKNSVDQQVIDFTAQYTGTDPGEIYNSTILSSIGIVTEEDVITYLTELEESFGLTYESGDQTGIITVGNAAEMIEKKLGIEVV
jgi:acyl carrier protein